MSNGWSQTVDLRSSEPCVKPQVPCAMVVFGGSGDLTSRKLVPALYRLHQNNYLPPQFALVGCSRTPYTDESYREHLYSQIENLYDMHSDKQHQQNIVIENRDNHSSAASPLF